ncbi:MAG: FAD-binding oxidoreductase [Oligoflexales bacterium]
MGISDTHRSYFCDVVGSEHVLTDPDKMRPYGTDWTKIPGKPSCVVLPRTTEEVSKILRYCNTHNLKVIPSGGRTGLAAAVTATNEELVLSLERFNKILNVDTVGKSMLLEAGVITQVAQERAKEVGLFFALDLASKGSCQVGGNIATNAGGLKLIRFGGMREQVLGLEVVLANGDILDLNYNLLKNNIGYDLKHLFIGSEGTLGVITKATVRLVNPLKGTDLALLQVPQFEKIPDIIQACNRNSLTVTAFEFFSNKCLNLVLSKFSKLKSPFAAPSEYYLLIERENHGAPGGFEDFLGELFEKGIVSDAVIASNSSEFRDLWSLRENISESLSTNKFLKKNDISVPISNMAEFVGELEKMKELDPKVDVYLFGHIGDGNVHLNYVGAESCTPEEFAERCLKLQNKVFERITHYKGSVSAEHGIGLLKKKDLKYCSTNVQMELMKTIKRSFDPNNILNPGKIFDL